MRRCYCFLAILFFLAAIPGCANEDGTSPEPDRCDEVIATLAECYPDLAMEGECTEETVARFDEFGLGSKDCDEVSQAGKADWFAFGGCGAGEHVCGLIFCCDDYVLTWYPKTESDWKIIQVVDDFQAEATTDIETNLATASRDELKKRLGWSYKQKVAEYPETDPVNMGVEITIGLVEVPYEDFVKILPAERWGVELDHYLGGEVKIYEKDDLGRATRQLERMVLSPFPCDWESVLSNNDMTKVEVIVYEPDRAKVYWRVMYSDNNSTETDVGSVEFRRYDEYSTLITFHSAHRLNAPGGIHIPTDMLRPALLLTFDDFVSRYQRFVESSY